MSTLIWDKPYDVKTMRIDTFMNENGIAHVDFLKIDTQGYDIYVVKSAGDRISDIREIVLEVQITDYELYKNSSKKNETIDYLTERGFSVYKSNRQSIDQEENIWFTNDRFKTGKFYHL